MAFQGYYDPHDPQAMMAMLQARGMPGRASRRFDEYYRCYPTIMMAGPEREYLNYGGKLILPPSALDKLTRLHITYPMLFELVNGQAQKTTHAGVLEFVAEEGKVYLPGWMMQTLLLEPGDMIQIKSTDLPQASLVKLQPQSTDFLDISDPKAVLENAFRNFSTLTVGDIFSFDYNDTIFDVAVLQVKPESAKNGVCMVETDVSVDFAPPVGYVEPDYKKNSGTSTPRSVKGMPVGGLLHGAGTMAQAINYDSIAPSATAAAAGARAVSSHFLSGGNKLNAKKSKSPATGSSAPMSSTANPPASAAAPRRTNLNGPQPLRLPPNKLFFGYEIKSVKTQEMKDKENAEAQQPRFEGIGQTLRGGAKKEEISSAGSGAEKKKELKKEPDGGHRLDGEKV